MKAKGIGVRGLCNIADAKLDDWQIGGLINDLQRLLVWRRFVTAGDSIDDAAGFVSSAVDSAMAAGMLRSEARRRAK